MADVEITGKTDYFAQHAAIINAGNHEAHTLTGEDIRPLDVIAYATGGVSGDVVQVRQWIGGDWDIQTTSGSIKARPHYRLLVLRPVEVTFTRTRDGRHTRVSGRLWNDPPTGYEAFPGAWRYVREDEEIPQWARNLAPGEWVTGPNPFAHDDEHQD